MSSCFFCKEYANLAKLPTDPPMTRKVYEDEFCQAALEPEQSVIGYTLVIPKSHYDTILAPMPDEEVVRYWQVVRKVGNAIKKSLGAENVYVCSLCDGIRHFHTHLIPRYKWTDKDKARFREIFEPSRGKETVDLSITLGLLGGFWYMGETEINLCDTPFMKLPKKEQFEEANRIALTIGECID